jgi:hypothetical protein
LSEKVTPIRANIENSEPWPLRFSAAALRRLSSPLVSIVSRFVELPQNEPQPPEAGDSHLRLVSDNTIDPHLAALAEQLVGSEQKEQRQQFTDEVRPRSRRFERAERIIGRPDEPVVKTHE